MNTRLLLLVGIASLTTGVIMEFQICSVNIAATFGDTKDPHLQLIHRVVDTLACAIMCLKDSGCQVFDFDTYQHTCKTFSRMMFIDKGNRIGGRKLRIIRETCRNRHGGTRQSNPIIASDNANVMTSTEAILFSINNKRDKDAPVYTNVSVSSNNTSQHADKRPDYRKLTKDNTTIYVKMHAEKMGWGKALKVCVSEGATLFKMESRDSKAIFIEHLQTMAMSMRLDNPWIGLRYTDTWRWTDGDKFGGRIGLSINLNNARCCVGTHSFAAARFEKFSCSRKFRFICELK